VKHRLNAPILSLAIHQYGDKIRKNFSSTGDKQSLCQLLRPKKLFFINTFNMICGHASISDPKKTDSVVKKIRTRMRVLSLNND
ncbi:MAG: hypothetical protein WAO55_15895, partial [Candidatus Manganitrophaceae bacterium]